MLRRQYAVLLAAFTVRTLNQKKQQAALDKALETFKIGLCCVCELCLENPISILIRLSLDANYSSRFILQVSCGLTSNSFGHVLS